MTAEQLTDAMLLWWGRGSDSTWAHVRAAVNKWLEWCGYQGWPVPRLSRDYLLEQRSRRLAAPANAVPVSTRHGIIYPRRRAERQPSLRDSVTRFIGSCTGLKPATRIEYGRVLGRVVDQLGPERPLAEASGTELTGAVTEQWGNCAKVTRVHVRSVISSWLTWCRVQGWDAPAAPDSV